MILRMGSIIRPSNRLCDLFYYITAAKTNIALAFPLLVFAVCVGRFCFSPVFVIISFLLVVISPMARNKCHHLRIFRLQRNVYNPEAIIKDLILVHHYQRF